MIKREAYMKKIRPFINKDIIKVLTGVRRCGKSVMLQLIQEELLNSGINKERFILMNFESMIDRAFIDQSSLYHEIKKRIGSINGKVYLFLDEIQDVREWEICVNSLRIEFDIDIYITGSNANLLSGELATYLAGRYIEIKVYPFSYLEFLEMGKENKLNLSETELFRKYLRFGGMPFLSGFDYDETVSSIYLRDIYNSVVLKDVIQRYAVRDAEMLERIILYVIGNIGHTFSAKSISDYLKSEMRNVAPETVMNYIRDCEHACLFNRIKRYDLVGKKILQLQEKIYLSDHGIREAIYGYNERDIDQIMENIVCMELIRRGYTVFVGKQNQREIDFIGEQRGNKIYIQVTYLIASKEVEDREFTPLQEIKDNFTKYIVSMDEFDFGKDGIKHKNIRDFLKLEQW